jgi:cytidyltransferase-like protein
MEPVMSDYSLGKTSRLLRRVRGGKRVVLTGGTFDLIHPGHLKYLARCVDEGDILVVCVAGDARTRRRKGSGRPFLSASQRAKIVSSLRMVDFVFVSNRKPFSPSILRQINPDVVVTSSNEPSRRIKQDFRKYMQERYLKIKVVLIHRPSSSWSSSSLIKSLINNGKSSARTPLL